MYDEVINHALDESDSAQLSVPPSVRLCPAEIRYIDSTNPGKLGEFSTFLGYPVLGREADYAEPQVTKGQIQRMEEGRWIGERYKEVAAEIASDKAKLALSHNDGIPVLIDDTSLFMDCLEGQPGPNIASFVSEAKLYQLCQAAKNDVPGIGVTDRAVAICTLAAWNGVNDEPQIWQGVVVGRIAPEPRGTNGFGWDRIFIPEGSDKTFAEMTDEEKSTYSMRRIALEKLVERPFLVPESSPLLELRMSA